MSKAFTREDDAPDEDLSPAGSIFDAGIPKYLTKEGIQRLQEEVAQTQEERSRLRQESPSIEVAYRLRRVEFRLRELGARLDAARVVVIPEGRLEEAQIGATVLLRDGPEELRYRIVGADEADFDRGWISWRSPLARALLGRVSASV